VAVRGLQIDEREVRGLVDPGTFARGLAYFRTGRVVEWAFTETGALTASVLGSGAHVYHVDIEVDDGEPVSFFCTCPVAGMCKHMVATMLQAISGPRERPSVALAAFRSEPRPEWMRTLDQIVAAAVPPPDLVGERSVTELALQIRVDGLQRRTGARTRAQTSGAAASRLREVEPFGGPGRRRPGGGAISLSVRPVKRSAKGAWTTGYEASWDGLRRAYGDRHQFDPVAREWFAELGAMRTQGYWGSSDWTGIEEFSPRLLWPHLARARLLGLRLVGTHKRDQVRLAQSAELLLDASEGADALVLAPVLTFDGVADTAPWRGAAGERGLFSVQPEGSDWIITLGPTSGPVSAAVAAMLQQTSAVRVPMADADRLRADYLPALRNTVTLTSRDGSVLLPPPQRPHLEFTVKFAGSAAVRIAARWAYRNRGGSDEGGGNGGPTTCYPFTVTESDFAARDVTGEQAVVARVEQAVRAAGFSDYAVTEVLEADGLAVLDIAETLLPVLRRIDDVIVHAVDQPDFVELTAEPMIELEANDTDVADWFDLAVNVTVDGKHVPLGNLLKALNKGKDRLLLADGSWIRLGHPSLDRLRVLLAEADRISDRRGALTVSRYQASLWDDLAELADVVAASAAWQASAGGLLALLERGEDGLTGEGAVPVPASVTAQLRPYQVRGFEWLAFCWRHGLGAVLADDMGLGKTLQALALVAYARESAADPSSIATSHGRPSSENTTDCRWLMPGRLGRPSKPPNADAQPQPASDDAPPAAPRAPFLVVAPASVVGNWVREAERFTPDLRVAVVSATSARRSEALSDIVPDADLVVTSYAIFRLDNAEFAALTWDGLILDEAQFIKNPATRANQQARALRARFKLAITGTPLENNLIDLWAIMAVVAPGLFPSLQRFREDYVRPVEAAGKYEAGEEVRLRAAERLARLQRRVRPLLLRRTKEQVAPELPERIEQVLEVELDPRHRLVYQTHLQRERKRVLGLLTDFEANKVAVFRALTLLRRLALDASLVEPEEYASVPSSKLDALFEQLPQIVSEGHRALVFSQFTSYLQKVAERCEAEGIEYAYLDGSTKNRRAVIDGFKDGSAPVFLISLKAGGFGLNLTEADYVYLLDPWWNPAAEQQAVDRTHRIGQTRPVNVIRLVAADTIEEKVMGLKARKARLIDAVLNDESAAFSGTLKAEDIRGLFD